VWNWLKRLFGKKTVSKQSFIAFKVVGANLRVFDDDVTYSNPVPVTGAVGSTTEVTQITPDDLNANANIQVGDVDVSASNPVPVDLGTTSTTPITVEQSNKSLDAFGRQRVSNPLTLFEVQHQYNEQPLLWDTVTASGGSITHLPNESAVSLDVTTASGSLVRRQTFQYFRYQPGKSQLIILTGILGAGKTGVRQRIGYFDASNGVFFEQDENNLKIVRRTSTSASPVDVVVNQSSWNIDTADGNGASGFDIDTSLAQIFVIDLQWLGVGKIRYGFETGNGIVYVHEDPNTNELTTPYMGTANLPITYEIENTSGTASNTSMKQICTTVVSEGGFLREGFPFSANNGTTPVSVGGSPLPVLSIRPKATFNSITNTARILPQDFSVFSDGGTLFYELVHAGSLTSPGWTSVDTNSIVEYDVSASAITGGRVIYSGYVSAGSPGKGSSGTDLGLFSRLPLLGSNALTIRVISITGPTNDVFSSLNWLETY